MVSFCKRVQTLLHSAARRGRAFYQVIQTKYGKLVKTSGELKPKLKKPYKCQKLKFFITGTTFTDFIQLIFLLIFVFRLFLFLYLIEDGFRQDSLPSWMKDQSSTVQLEMIQSQKVSTSAHEEAVFPRILHYDFLGI